MLTRKTRRGDTVVYGYDTLKRLISKTPPASTPVVCYAYDVARRLVGVSDPSASIVTPSSSASYAMATTYDALNRPLGSSWSGVAAQTAPGSAFSVTFIHGYDANNRRIG